MDGSIATVQQKVRCITSFFVLKYVFMTTGKIIKEYLSNGTIQQGEFRLWNYDVLTSKVYLYKKWEK